MLDSRRCFAWFAGLVFSATVLSSYAQISANGYIDTAFNPSCVNTPSADFTTRALLVQADGRILAGGNYTTAVGACRNGIVRLRTNGVTDTTFDSFLQPGSFVTGIATQSTGKIIVSGFMGSGGTTFPIARLGLNGALDNSFLRLGDAGLVGNAVLVQPDDKLIVAGSFTVGNSSSGFIARLKNSNNAGDLDPTFANGSSVTDGGVSVQGIGALAYQSGKILVGGSFTTYNDGTGVSNRSGLARLNDDGSLDKTFRAPLTNADVRAILLQPDGKILLAGSFTTQDGAGHCLTRLNANGTRDTSFTPDAVGVTALSLALEPDGKILVGHTLGVMRVTTNGLVDTTFGPRNADGFLGTRADFASAVARSMESNILVGARSVTVNTTSRRGIIRLFGNVPPPPTIVALSTNLTVDAGTNVTFSVLATGAPPISYQWRKNGTKLTGATSTNLTLLDVDSTDTGYYSVIASNPGGSTTSSVVRLTVNFFVSPISVTVQPVNGGTVTPDFDGRGLEIGRTYTFTAKPAKGFLFTNWSGFETASTPVLTFVMQSNEVLQANFVPSPFIPVRGAYAGLFYDTNAPAHENAGAFALTLDDRGGFKGTVTMGRAKRKFRGTFSLERVAVVTIPATTTLPPLELALALDTAAGFIDGTVAIGTNAPATLAAFRKVFSAKLNPVPHAGLYNAALPSTNDPALAPPGDGYVPLSISTSGRVSGKGALADGSGWSVVSATSVEGWVPVYASLYSGAGSIFGWLTVTNTGGANDVAGTLWWKKPGGLSSLIHPAGITNRIDTIGSRFVPVAKGTPVLNLPAGAAVLSYGNLPDSITNAITLGGDNRILGSNALVLTFSTTKGTMVGSFIDPTTARKRTVKGVVLPNQNQARGFFLGTDEGGAVLVGE
jgi:uncharacterized delta-60 repeat protein